MPLAHAADAQGILAAEQILGLDPARINFDLIPRCVYCVPEIASVGLTEDQCRRQGIAFRIGRFPFRANGKALSSGEPDGFIKLIAEANTLAVLGAHIYGAHASELIMQCALLMRYEIPLDELKVAVFPHPSLSEAIRDAAEGLID
jgi:dihydrolipoamide dehydrogenase